ncbi:MAG: hypothetical protein ABR970_11885 [Roseiarcus sp.]
MMAARSKLAGISLALGLWAGAAAAQDAPAAAPAPPSAAAVPMPSGVGPAPPIEPPKIETPKPRRPAVPPAPPRETALSEDPTPTLQPDTYFATLKAAERYAGIAQAGGWLEVAAPLRPSIRPPPRTARRRAPGTAMSPRR